MSSSVWKGVQSKSTHVASVSGVFCVFCDGATIHQHVVLPVLGSEVPPRERSYSPAEHRHNLLLLLFVCACSPSVKSDSTAKSLIYTHPPTHNFIFYFVAFARSTPEIISFRAFLSVLCGCAPIILTLLSPVFFLRNSSSFLFLFS